MTITRSTLDDAEQVSRARDRAEHQNQRVRVLLVPRSHVLPPVDPVAVAMTCDDGPEHPWATILMGIGVALEEAYDLGPLSDDSHAADAIAARLRELADKLTETN